MKNTSAMGRQAPRNFAEYVGRVPVAARAHVRGMRKLIQSVVPAGAVETISYGIPAFRQEKVLVWYAGFASHCSLFPTASVIAQFREDLNGFNVSKGTIQVPLEKPLPASLIKRIVRARLAELSE